MNIKTHQGSICFLMVAIVFTGLMLGIGCSESNQVQTINTSSKVLNEFVNTTHFQKINLDRAQTRDVKLGTENIIYSIYDETDNNNAILGHINSAILVSDIFYINDIPTKGVYKINERGTISGSLTRTGKGPGELNTVSKIFNNSESIYIPDYNNGRINQYSHNMKTKRVLDNFLMTDVEIIEDYIFGTNRMNQGFFPQNPNEGLIVVSSVESLEDTIKTIMPRIIPEGYQPQVYNRVRFSANNIGQSIAAYSPLPWIFIFNENFQHTNTLILNYAAFDTLDVPKMELFKPKGNKGYGGQIPINDFKLMDNGDIYLTLREELVYLSKNNTGEYEVISKIKFAHNFKENSSKWTWVYNKVFDSKSDTVFVHNSEFMFRFIN